MRACVRIVRMFTKRASSPSDPVPASASPPAAKQSAPPVITPEADRAIFGVQLRYGMIMFGLAIFSVILLMIVAAKFPHSLLLKRIVESKPLFAVVACVWLIPYFIGQVKQANLRIGFAREYASQQRWGVVVAALRSFTDWGQRSFDRDGEAHYMLAQAYDRLNRKDQARKAREFVRKHRSGSEWAKKLGPAPGAPRVRPTVSRVKPVAQIDANSTPNSETGNAAAVGVGGASKRAGQTLSKPSRRKRF